MQTTQYNLKNNSTDKAVEKFYIDHTADASHGGYVITTKEKVIKAVTGTNFKFPRNSKFLKDGLVMNLN